MRLFFAFAIASLAAVGQSRASVATTQPVTQPTAPSLEVHEWAVFVLDASAKKINPDGVVVSTMPAFVNDHRFGASGYTPPAEAAALNGNRGMMLAKGWGTGAAAPSASSIHTGVDAAEPTPVGVIRLIGSVDSKVDVTIGNTGGTFLGSWPKAEERSNQLLWRDITVGDQSESAMQIAPDDSWFTKLRSGNSAMLSMDKNHPEKFLMYDIELPQASPLKVKQLKDSSAELSNTGNYPLHDLTLYQTDERGNLLMVEAGELPKAASPATRPSTSTSKPTTRQASTQPVPFGTIYRLAPAPTTQPTELVTAWKSRMSEAGIDPADSAIIGRIIARYALDGRRLTAMYQMDEAEFDKLLPIEVVPQPAKIKRFGLVIIQNADPSAPTEIDELIALLGDEQWSKRDAAYHALADRGPAATAKLTAAKSNKDLEIAWRAERLLAATAKAK